MRLLSIWKERPSILFYLLFPFCLQTMKVKLQPPSATDLPAYNPILPPTAITQVMLIANPNKVSFTLHVPNLASFRDRNKRTKRAKKILPDNWSFQYNPEQFSLFETHQRQFPDPFNRHFVLYYSRKRSGWSLNWLTIPLMDHRAMWEKKTNFLCNERSFVSAFSLLVKLPLSKTLW